MEVWVAAVLGAIQGATEFLPVSSSGHVALGAMLLGASDEMPLSMVVLLHTGTLIATVALFRRDVAALLRSCLDVFSGPRAWSETEDGKTILAILAASVPTALIGLYLEPRVEEMSRVEWVLGLGLIGSAIVVGSTARGGGDKSSPTLWHALVIGAAQGLAVLPGLSRSGTTIAVAMMLGLSGPAAFRFSFLLSLPAVLGATGLSLRHTEELSALGGGAIVGSLVAMVTGFFALVWLRKLVDQGRFWMFAPYLVCIGGALIVYGFVWA